MNMAFRIVLLPALLGAVLLATGCDPRPGTESMVVEEGIISDDGKSDADWVVDEIVPIPPAKPAVAAGKRPSTNDIWIAGEWKREHDQWVWENGHWQQPPAKDANWTAGHWRFEGSKWHWTPGHWVVSSQRHYFTSPLDVPTLQQETRPDKPSEHNHWISGYWDWAGYWYWIPGHWTTSPHPDAEWIPGHWDEFAHSGGFRWIGGHWELK